MSIPATTLSTWSTLADSLPFPHGTLVQATISVILLHGLLRAVSILVDRPYRTVFHRVRVMIRDWLEWALVDSNEHAADGLSRAPKAVVFVAMIGGYALAAWFLTASALLSLGIVRVAASDPRLAFEAVGMTCGCAFVFRMTLVSARRHRRRLFS